MNWTDERVETMKKLWSDGLSASQIANHFGDVSRNAVIGKVHRLKFSSRRGSTATPKSAQALRVSGSVPCAIRPTEDVAIPTSQHLQLVELTTRTCKWPNGDPLSDDFNFCGNDAVDGRLGKSNTEIPYCKYHCRLAYQPAYERHHAR